jgi:hypothetical protein
MPHQNLPQESWVDWLLGLIGTAIIGILSWIASIVWGRVTDLEKATEDNKARIETLERLAAVADERHRESQRRLESIDDRSERMDRKLDRIVERI